MKRSREYNELRKARRRLLECAGKKHIPVIHEIAEQCRLKLELSVLPTSQYSAMAKAFAARPDGALGGSCDRTAGEGESG